MPSSPLHCTIALAQWNAFCNFFRPQDFWFFEPFTVALHYVFIGLCHLLSEESLCDRGKGCPVIAVWFLTLLPHCLVNILIETILFQINSEPCICTWYLGPDSPCHISQISDSPKLIASLCSSRTAGMMLVELRASGCWASW